MAREPRKRVELDPAQGGLNAAFASLPLDGLRLAPEPAGQAAPVPAVEKKGAGRVVRVVLRREKAGRSGKTVIVLAGFDPPLDPPALDALAKKLRAGCGTGGTVREGAIEIQGDQAGRLRELLADLGFRAAGP